MSDASTAARPQTSPQWAVAGAHSASGDGTRHSRPSWWRRRATLATIGAVWLIAAIGGAIVGTFESFGPPPLGRDLEVSTLVLDRNGKLLRAYLTSEGRWRLPATREQVDPIFLEALLAYEDKRFFFHPGVDPLAVMRAAYQFVTHGRIVSGGSTITMQVARLLEPRRHRSLDAKIRQTVRALELEWALSKDEILGLYLTLAPYGGNLEGIRAASLAYFGKEPRRLTLGEAALLVALPQSPEFRRPDRFPEKAKLARDRVLDRIAGKGLFSDAEIAHAKQEDVPTARKKMPLIAPHAADQALAANAERARRAADNRWRSAKVSGKARPRARRDARRRHVGRHRRGRQRNRRGAGPGRLSRLFRRAARRARSISRRRSARRARRSSPSSMASASRTG